MRKLQPVLIFILLNLWLVSLFGCAAVKENSKKVKNEAIEIAKGVAGVSTKILEDTRPAAIKRTINYGYEECRKRTLDALKIMRCYIYAQDAKLDLIAIYVSETDTTPVGIFFSHIDSANTQVEVSSPSTYAKENISQRLFSELELPTPEKKPVSETAPVVQVK